MQKRNFLLRKSQTFYRILFGEGGSLQSRSDNSARLSNLRFQTHANVKIFEGCVITGREWVTINTPIITGPP